VILERQSSFDNFFNDLKVMAEDVAIRSLKENRLKDTNTGALSPPPPQQREATDAVTDEFASKTISV
jgi:hypothetical protein